MADTWGYEVGCEVTIFCPLCEIDLPVWTREVGSPLPSVEHRPDGTHLMHWPVREEDTDG